MDCISAWVHCSLFNLIVHLLMKSDHKTLKLLQFLLNCAGLRVGKYLLLWVFFVFNSVSILVTQVFHYMLIMAALHSRCGHYIFARGFFYLLSFFFFPRLFSAVADWTSTTSTRGVVLAQI